MTPDGLAAAAMNRDHSRETGDVQSPPGAPSPELPPPPQHKPAARQAPKPAAVAHPASTWGKVGLAVYLFGLAMALLWLTARRIDDVNREAFAQVSVPWEMPSGVTLRSGPSSFRYDRPGRRLVHRGPVTADRRAELLPLLVPEAPAMEANVAAIRRSYEEAIENLAELSTERQAALLGLLLVLGALGGAVGAVLRSLVDFVGHACYTLQLDLVRWWPLYFTRPLIGALLGFVIVVAFKAQLITGSAARPTDDSLWWLGVAIIGGFSTVDVTLRLRIAAKALFGVESSSRPAPDKSDRSVHEEAPPKENGGSQGAIT